MNPGESGHVLSDAAALCNRYEQMRKIAVGGILKANGRDGFHVFLRRGMWRWAWTVDIHDTEVRNLSARADRQSAPVQQSIVIHLLAQVAMATSRRRAQ